MSDIPKSERSESRLEARIVSAANFANVNNNGNCNYNNASNANGVRPDFTDAHIGQAPACVNGKGEAVPSGDIPG